jgi:hypothetical protein
MNKMALASVFVLAFLTASFSLAGLVKADTLGEPIIRDGAWASGAFTVFSPCSEELNASTVLLNFSLSWLGSVGTVGYSLDDAVVEQVITNYVEQNGSEPFLSFSSDKPLTVTGSLYLEDLRNGNHTVILYHGHQKDANRRFDVVAFSSVNFSVNAPAVYLIQNRSSYSSGDVPVRFITSEPLVWAGYSIDNLTNATLSGNTTITGLANGYHNITVYAMDEAGNIGGSNIICFNVNKPGNVSPQTAILLPTTPEFPLAVTLAVFFAVLAVAFVLLRRKSLSD